MALSGKPQRRSIRLYQYDYSQSGAYFITICTYNHRDIFGKIVDERIELNALGNIVEEC
jgi:putative transposase